jgi:NADH dehydrogenase (ubiquinone) 1 alpha/beta subcomplex 1
MPFLFLRVRLVTRLMFHAARPASRALFRASASRQLSALARTSVVSAARTQARPALLIGQLQAQQRRGFAAAFLDEADVTDRVLGCVKNFPKVDPTKVSAGSSFVNDLGLDSLDTVEVVMVFEDEFAIEIPDADAEKIQSCEDAIKYILQHPHAK